MPLLLPSGPTRSLPAIALLLWAMLAWASASLLAQNPLRIAKSVPLSANPLRSAETAAPQTPDSPLGRRNQYIQQAFALAAKEQWEEAIQRAQQALQLQRRQIGAETEDACLLLEQIAAWQERHADFAQALITWQELEALSEKVRGHDYWHTVAIRATAECCRRAAQLKSVDQRRLADAAGNSLQAEHLFASGKFAESRDQALHALQIRSELLGPDDILTASSLHDVGAAYLGLGDARAARPNFEQCVALREHSFGSENPYTLASLTNLSVVYDNLDLPKLAAPVLETILNGSTKLYGPKHPTTVQALFALANFQLQQHDLAQAEPALNLVVMLQRANDNGKNLDLAKTLGRLGFLYLQKPDYPLAEKCLQESLQLYQQLAGEKDPSTANANVNLGVLDYAMKKYGAAQQHFQNAVDIYTQACGENHSDTIDAQHWLARVLPFTGDEARAERLCRHVLQFYDQTLDKNDPRIAQLLLQMGVLYCGWNDIGSAEPCLQRAVEINRQTLGDEHPDTAGVMVMLATIDAKSGRFDQAQKNCQAALAVLQRVRGASDPQTAAAALALGNIYILAEKNDQAEQQLQQLLATRPDQSVDDRYRNAIILEKLANVALQRGDYIQALARAQRVTEIYRETLADGSPHQVEALLLAGIASHALDHDAQAKQLGDKALEIARNQLDTAATAQSERQQLALNYRWRNILDLHLSLPPEQTTSRESYGHVLEWKGAIQARQIRDRQNRDPAAAVQLLQLQQTCAQLSTLSLQVPDPAERLAWLKQIEQLRTRKENIEADLAASSHPFCTQQKAQAVSPGNIQEALPAETALVDVLEYVSFSGGHAPATPDETRYVAFVVRHDRPVVRVELGSAQPINDAVESWRRNGLFQSQAAHHDPCEQLHALVWQPLEPYLDGCSQILFSPDAALSQFPLAVLPGKKPGSYLIEDLAIGILPVPQLLPEMLAAEADPEPKQPPPAPQFLMVGNINYDAAAGESEETNQNTLSKDSAGGELLSFDRLKSAPAEIGTLRALFNQRFPLGQLRVLEQGDATEAAFRQQAPLCNWLFVATHGFYAPPNVASALAVQDELVGLGAHHGGNHSGALSGLALAGANLPAQPGCDDGILTTSEVATLDLRGVDLAVLSGCETGLGENAMGEGAIGLQRAFQVAGARTTVASLWSVPDQKTSLLMQRFYENLWDRNMSKLEALRAAQRSLIHENEQTSSAGKDTANSTAPLAPYYWAAFVLSGDWR